MRLRFVNLLLAALLVLATARLWTALRAPEPQLPPAPAAEPAAGKVTAPEEQPGEAAPGTGTEGYDVIAARDLFSAARGVVPPAPPDKVKPVPPPKPPPKLTLTGVVIVDGEKSAFLQEGAQEARPRKVREGEAFAGGTVKLIRPDGITFLFAGSESTVALRTPKDTGPAPRPGEVPPPVQPDASQRRPPQPGLPDPGAQLRRPQQPIPGVPRLMPPPDEEPVFTDEEIPLDDEEEFIDEGEMIDDSEISPEEFEEQVQ